MQVVIDSLNTSFYLKKCVAGVKLTRQVGDLVVVDSQIEVPIAKPYDNIGPALKWEVAKKLSGLGYDVEVPEMPESGLIPDTVSFADVQGAHDELPVAGS